jgi:hypothetical protein
MLPILIDQFKIKELLNCLGNLIKYCIQRCFFKIIGNELLNISQVKSIHSCQLSKKNICEIGLTSDQMLTVGQ